MITADLAGKQKILETLLQEVALSEGTDDEKLQAVTALRVTVWANVIALAHELDGPEEFRRTAEAFAEADSLLAALVFGWVPGTAGAADLPSISRRANRLMRRLLRRLGKMLRNKQMDPVYACLTVDALYRKTVCDILAGARGPEVTRCLELHRALRLDVVRMAHELSGCEGGA